MANIPKLKKKISSFLTKEEGKISKEALIKTGILLSAAALASLKSVSAGTTDGCPPDTTSGGTAASPAKSHCNELSLSYAGSTATGTHEHGTHSSY